MLQTCRCRITLSLPVKILPRLWCGLSSNFLDHLLYSGVLFFSRPRSDSWPHHGRTFSIYLCLLSFWLTLPEHAWSSSTAFTWHCSLHYLFLQATPLFPVPRTCLPAATVNPVWALYLSLQFLISVLFFAFCFLLFPDCCESLSDIHFCFFCDLTHPIVSLATSSRTVLIPFQRSGVTLVDLSILLCGHPVL